MGFYNIVFLGHVDSGKSSLCGTILVESGSVDVRRAEEAERDAEASAGKGWSRAFLLDTSPEERNRGKTVETGREIFTFEEHEYTILDAPGHRNYVPNAIEGIACADIAILVVSARKGEFEAGFDCKSEDISGQTREHATLAKALGVQRLIVFVNKMDTIEWNQDRYKTIKEKLSKFLKSIDFLKACTFVPGSGLSGENVFSRCGEEPCLLEVIHQQSSLVRRKQGDLLRLSVTYSTRDCGKIMSFVRVENGQVHTGMDLYDEKGKVTILEIQNQKGSNVTNLSQGENGVLFLSSREELPYSFLCSHDCILAPRTQLLVLLQVLEQTPLFCSGLECVLQLFLNKRECVVEKIIGLQEGEKFTKALFLRKGQVGKVVLKVDHPLLAETFTNYPKLGRFVLRNKSQTIALGKIVGVK